MKYTKEQLQAMNDFEVNSTLADFINVKWQISAVDDECLMVGAEVLVYCNNPSDIMPLAFEHDIAYLRTYKTAYCKIDGQKHKQRYTDESPLRAIACCLILVLQGEKE